MMAIDLLIIPSKLDQKCFPRLAITISIICVFCERLQLIIFLLLQWEYIGWVLFNAFIMIGFFSRYFGY